MPGAGETTRTVVVQPLSTRTETLLVARTVFHILFWSAVVIALERAASPKEHRASIATPAAPASAAPVARVGEIAASELDPRDRSLFSVMVGAAAALEKERARTGAWAPSESLPPPDAGSSRWKRLQEGVVTSYIAVPDASSGRSTFMIVFVEPEPGIPSDPQAVADEIHHRLPDGTLLHVTIWKAPDARDVARPIANPAPEDGWRRITRSVG